MSRSASRTPAVPPPHAPELGPMRRLLGGFHVTGIFWYRIHRWGMKVLPEWGVWLGIAVFTTFFFVALRCIRKAIAANLAVVLGPCGWWRRQGRIYRTMWKFAWCLSERYERLTTDRRDAEETIVGQEVWDRALASPEGLILVTAHIGHWEVGAMRVPRRHVHVVREEEMDPKAQEFLGGLFAELGDTGFTMHFVRDDAVLGLKLLQALRRGDFVALQGDRPRSSGRSSTVPVFGRPLALPAGPAALARAAGVALLPVFVFRRGRRSSQVVFRPPIRVTEPGAEGLAAATAKIAAEVEWAIRQDPFQWFCFRKLWPGGGGLSELRPLPTARRFSLPALAAEMHYQLRTEGGTPRGTAISVGVGTFIGCLPLYGLHFFICVFLARRLGASRLKTYLAANISNPLFAPFLIYLELGVGHWIFEGSWPSLRIAELKASGAWALGRDLVAGSLGVGAVLALALGTLAFHVARRWQRAPFEERLREATSRRYLECGISHWEFVRGKLRYDPMYRAILGSGVLPREGRLVDVGCGRGILLALVDTARRKELVRPPPDWRSPAAGLELVGIEVRRSLAAVARWALGDGARIEVGDAAAGILPRARAILLLDVLHYLTAAQQEAILDRVAGALEPGGVLVLREADAALGWRFALTRAAERLCALGRGHWRQRFHYRSAAGWRRLLERHGLEVSERPMWAGTPYANRLVEARKG